MDHMAANAVAGPSKTRHSHSPSSPAPPMNSENDVQYPLFLPPEGPLPEPIYMRSTEDLLGKFRLVEAYDKYVRPFATPTTDSIDSGGNKASLGSALNPPTVGVGTVDKGKGKEVLPNASPTVADLQDDEQAGGKKKKKNSYRHLIEGIPGRHSTKKDDYLTTMLQAPPKERVKIFQFDMRTQIDAFSVTAGGIPGYNIKSIIESAQAKEERKKAREARKLQIDTNTAQSSVSASAPTHQQIPIQAPIPTSATSSSSLPTSQKIAKSTVSGTPVSAVAVTPRPQSATSGPRPGSTKPHPPPVLLPVPGAKVGTPLRTATPIGPHPLSAPPLSAETLSLDNPSNSQLPRGKKRERDTSDLGTPVANGLHASKGPNTAVEAHTVNANAPMKAIVGAKAGSAGIRPRPVKKQKMDLQGQARDTVPVQQPTPQGV